MDAGALSASGEASIPHLANRPTLGVIWHRPQIPRPPHTVSRSAPSWRAASRTLVPATTLPSRPDGVKTTRWNAVTSVTPRLGGAGDLRARPVHPPGHS